MPVYDLYSKRKLSAEKTEPDVFQYTGLPNTVRTQIRQVWDDAIGPYWDPSAGYFTEAPPHNNSTWEAIRKILCRERGILSLAGQVNASKDVIMYFNAEKNIDLALDVVELSCRAIASLGARPRYEREKTLGIKQSADDALSEINHRLQAAQVGYQFEAGKIVRVDSQFVHAEVVKPALQLLSDPRFKGAQEEFLEAHAKHRSGDNKGAVTEALKAFESTLKAICDAKKWEYPKGARASDLLKLVRKNGLLPDYLDQSFDQLVATLASGLPKVRNDAGAHGQGAAPKETPGYVAAYAVHLAAVKIVLLVEAFKSA